MPNFVKISREIKKISIQELDFDGLVCVTAICCSGLISVVPKNEQLHWVKRTCLKFQNDISKTEGLVREGTDRRTGEWTGRRTRLDRFDPSC